MKTRPSKAHPKYSPLFPVNLTQVTTKDGIDLAGVVVEPKGKKKAALIWVHGLTSAYDHGQKLMSELSRACVSQGIGYFKFNTRGHHLVDYGPTKKNPFNGASHERFQDCLLDIDAVIRLTKRLGYRRIILAGHSTGASKVLYYTVRRKDPRIKAVLLAGPASDIAGELMHVRPATLLSRVAIARRLAIRQPHELVPPSWGPWSNQRYVSLFTPGSIEEVFPYHRLGGRWTYLRNIRVPVLMVSGEKDKYLDIPAKNILELFKKKAEHTTSFTGCVILGASHGFQQHQRQLVGVISRWLRSTV